MKSARTLKLTALATLAIACGSSEPAPETPSGTPTAETPAAAQDADPLEMCTQMFVRQRECQDSFLPALVDLRVRLDVPAGIAERDATEGRETLLGWAREEFAEDSTDEAIAATCEKIISEMPEEQTTGAMNTATECLQADTCGDFVPCALSIIEGHLK